MFCVAKPTERFTVILPPHEWELIPCIKRMEENRRMEPIQDQKGETRGLKWRRAYHQQNKEAKSFTLGRKLQSLESKELQGPLFTAVGWLR